ncbi:MAG: hypothetical protein ACI8W8_003637 [Rhodothermales bacterium]
MIYRAIPGDTFPYALKRRIKIRETGGWRVPARIAEPSHEAYFDALDIKIERKRNGPPSCFTLDSWDDYQQIAKQEKLYRAHGEGLLEIPARACVAPELRLRGTDVELYFTGNRILPSDIKHVAADLFSLAIWLFGNSQSPSRQTRTISYRIGPTTPCILN